MAKSTGSRDLIFYAEEPSFASALPTPVAADAVFAIDAPTFKQSVPMLDDPERKNTYDPVRQLRDKSDVGTFQFKCFLKQSGTAGTEIQAGLSKILEHFFGRKTVNAGTNVIYQQLRTSDTQKTGAIFVRVGDEENLQHSGALITKLNIVITAKGNDSILAATVSGVFAQQRRAGKALTTAGSTTTSVVLAAGNGQFFDAGALITVTGFTPNPNPITSIAVDTLTVPAMNLGAGSGVVVKGYTPTPVDVGFLISGWRGVATLGGVNFPVTRVEFNLEHNHEVLVDEKTGLDFASGFIVNVTSRNYTANVTYYFDPATAIGGANKWYNALNQIQQSLIVPVGDQAGKIYTFTAAQTELMDTPDIDSSGKVMHTLRYRLLASSAGDDAMVVTLT